MAPLLLLALLTAASGAANYEGQKKTDNARAAAMAEEARRRRQAEQRSAQSAQSTTQLLTNAGRNQDAKAAEIEAQYAAHAAPMGAPTTSTQLSGFRAPPRSTLTVADDQRAFGKASSEAAALAKANATLGAYGDAMTGAQIGANRNLSDINQENTGVRNWNQNVLPLKMAAANDAGKNWHTLADAIQLAASIYAPIGLSKGGAAGFKRAYDVSTTSGAGGAGFPILV